MRRLINILIFLLVILPAGLSAQSRNDKTKVQKQKQETTKKLKQSTRQFELNKEQTAKRLRELTVVEGEILDLTKEIKNREKSIDSISIIIKNTTDTINDLDSRLNNLSDKYGEALKRQQGNYRSPSTISYLFASKNVSQALRRYRALKQFAKWRARKADEITDIKKKLEARHNELSQLKDSQAKLLSQLSDKKDELTRSKKKNEEIIKGLKRKEKEIKSIIDDSRKELQQLDKQLEKLIAEEQARIAEERRKEEERQKAEEARLAEERRIAEQKRLEDEKKAVEQAKKQAAKKKDEKSGKSKGKNDKKSKTKIDNQKVAQTQEPEKVEKPNINASADANLTARSASQLSSGFESSKGKLPYPIDGRHIIVRNFGKQKHPNLPLIETDNPGIDISADKNSTARAVYEGIVSAIFKQPGFHNVVMIRHGDYITIYANLENITVKKGDRVGAGTALGQIAVDEDDVKGRSILHFEIRHEKEKENPTIWLR